MPLDLFKAHAYGNDFLFARLDQTVDTARAELARRVCDRHTGLGADGLILYTPTATGAAMTLYNADGGVAEVSGNGLRCLAAWVARQRGEMAAEAGEIVIDTDGGVKTLTLLEQADPRYLFRADMGRPDRIRPVELTIAGAPIRVVTLSVGNPQCVVLMASFDDAERRFGELGAGLATHAHFPQGTNVELVVVERPDRLRILIWERGVGPTSASGTGACAAAVAAARFGGAGREVEVVSPGGTQRVGWVDDHLALTGWAELVARGQWLGG